MHRNHSSRRPSHQGNPAAHQRSLFGKQAGTIPRPALTFPGWVATVASLARDLRGIDFDEAGIYRDLSRVVQVYGIDKTLESWHAYCEDEPARVRVAPRHFAASAAWWCKWRHHPLGPDLVFAPPEYQLHPSTDQLRFSGRPGTAPKSWAARAMGIWGYYIGMCNPGRLAKVLAPIVQVHGQEPTLAALADFCRTEPYRRRDGTLPTGLDGAVWNPRAMTPERFAHNVAFWLARGAKPV